MGQSNPPNSDKAMDLLQLHLRIGIKLVYVADKEKVMSSTTKKFSRTQRRIMRKLVCTKSTQ